MLNVIGTVFLLAAAPVETVACTNCNAVGYVTVKCATCSGSGYVYYRKDGVKTYTNGHMAYGAGNVKRSCPKCGKLGGINSKGTGKVRQKCPVCLGKKKVNKD